MLIKFKEKITGKTAAGGTKDVEIMVPLKYLCNFWRKFKMSLMNSEIILNLTWSDKCLLSSGTKATIFSITNTKLCSSCNFINSR